MKNKLKEIQTIRKYLFALPRYEINKWVPLNQHELLKELQLYCSEFSGQDQLQLVVHLVDMADSRVKTISSSLLVQVQYNQRAKQIAILSTCLDSKRLHSVRNQSHRASGQSSSPDSSNKHIQRPLDCSQSNCKCLHKLVLNEIALKRKFTQAAIVDFLLTKSANSGLNTNQSEAISAANSSSKRMKQNESTYSSTSIYQDQNADMKHKKPYTSDIATAAAYESSDAEGLEVSDEIESDLLNKQTNNHQQGQISSSSTLAISTTAAYESTEEETSDISSTNDEENKTNQLNFKNRYDQIESNLLNKQGLNNHQQGQISSLTNYDYDSTPIHDDPVRCCRKIAEFERQKDSYYGISLFVESHADIRSEALAELAPKFAELLVISANAFKIDISTMAIFYEQGTKTIAFNQNGLLVFNLAHFIQIYPSNSKAESRQRYASFWYVCMAHELAHNFIKAHGIEFNEYVQQLVADHQVRFVDLYRASSW